jgi:hypothetical protein
VDGDTILSFKAVNSTRLAEAGLKGSFVTVTYQDSALEFVGDAGGGVRLSAPMVDRMRVGAEEGRNRTIFQTMIWPKGDKKPIAIYPRGDVAMHDSYAAAIRAYAAALTQAHGVGRVEGGVSPASALVGVLLFSLPAVGYTVAAMLRASREQWLGWLVAGILFWGLAAIFVWIYVTRQRPRPLRDLAELERQLPKVVGG